MAIARTDAQEIRAKGGRTWLDDLMLTRHEVARALDERLADAPIPTGSALVLSNFDDAGYGDVAFAAKLLHLLAEGAPSLSVTLATSSLRQKADIEANVDMDASYR